MARVATDVINRLRSGKRLPEWLSGIAQNKGFRATLSRLIDQIVPHLRWVWRLEEQVVVVNATAALSLLALKPFQTRCRYAWADSDCGLTRVMLRGKTWINSKGVTVSYKKFDASCAVVRFASYGPALPPDAAEAVLAALEGDELARSRVVGLLGDVRWAFAVPEGRKVVTAHELRGMQR